MFENLFNKNEKNKQFESYQHTFTDGTEFVVTVVHNEYHFVISDAENNTFDLARLVKGSIQFAYSSNDEWMATVDEVGKSSIQFGKFTEIRDILSLLHEIGHVNNVIDTQLALDAQQKYSQKKYSAGIHSEKMERVRLLYEAHDLTKISERNAWAFALRSIRSIEKRMNVTLQEDLGSSAEIRQYIERHLHQYEESAQEEMSVLSEESIQKILGDPSN